MNYLDFDTPIISCATNFSTNTALAVIRISGFTDLNIFRPHFSISTDRIKPRHAHVTNLIFDGKVVDEIVLTYFAAPASFTGENLLELSVHGNSLNVRRIIDSFISLLNFRHSAPGEFTYRAFKNKKLDLSQVEGLDLLLNASSDFAFNQGLEILNGSLHKLYLDLRSSFLKCKSSLELLIDFSEDVGEEQGIELFWDGFSRFERILFDLERRCLTSSENLLSPTLSIFGLPNAGKSSLFNILLSHERSIVSSIPGTTRDFVSEYIDVGGVKFRLIDTAGIRDTSDEIELHGIRFSYDFLQNSFFKILLINPFEVHHFSLEKFDFSQFDFIFFTHSDVANFSQSLSKFSFIFEHWNSQIFYCSLKTGSIGPIDIGGSIGPEFKARGPIEPGPNLGPIGPNQHNFAGPMGPLFSLIANGALGKFNLASQDAPILLDRHKHCLLRCALKTRSFRNNFKTLGDVAIASSELSLIEPDVFELIGVVSAEDVLTDIFSNFCIGK